MLRVRISLTSMTLLLSADFDIDRAGELLRNGALVAFPTETVYGLGASIKHPESVARIFAAKERPHFDPLIIHVADGNDASAIGDVSDARIQKLTRAFWPGPLTVVVPRIDAPDVATSGLSTVALRVPANEIARRIIRAANVPIAAPSANRFGRLSPTRAADVLADLDGRIDAVIDGGDTTVGVESTIVTCDDDGVWVLRDGGIPREDIACVVGEDVRERTSLIDHHAPLAPGQLATHYAPRAPLHIIRDLSELEKVDTSAAAIILQRRPRVSLRASRVIVLSETNRSTEAASRLFRALHDADQPEISVIYAELAEEIGIGRAINDRLRRAGRS